MPICLSKKSKFATNSPISLIFNFWSRDMSRDQKLKMRDIGELVANETLRHKKTSRFTFGENIIILGLLARDIANHSYA